MTLLRLEDRPLADRLRLLIVSSAGLTALICGVFILVAALWIGERRARDLTAGFTRVMAEVLHEPMGRGDREAVHRTLLTVRTRGEIRGAWAFDTQGRLVGRFGDLPPPAAEDEGGLSRGYVMHREPVRRGTEPVGEIVVRAELGQLAGVIAFAAGAVVLAGVIAVGVSLLLGRRIVRTIAEPVHDLARTVTDIAEQQDYSRRLTVSQRDEIGQAVSAVNHMLLELQRREAALLELRVAERTHELELERDQAEAASRAKSSFLSHMSHELRTPLNAVIGAAQLLDERRTVDDSQLHLVEAIRDSGTRLLGLIENILDLSRIESGALDLSDEDFNLVECAEAAVATAAVQARLKGLRTACIVDPGLAAWRVGDAMRLRQVLLNLLGNAVKFTQAGEVVLRVEASPDGQGVLLSVRDTGMGMDAQAQTLVFEPFRQADSSTTRRFGGSGLGLAIARQLVQAMGGRITLESQAGAGTTFLLELPLPAATHQPTPRPVPLDRPVVYFEPHEPSAQALEALLRRMGCEATRVTDSASLAAWCGARAADAPAPWLLVAVDAPQTWPLLDAAPAAIDQERVIGMTHRESHSAEMARELHRIPRNVIKPVSRAALASRFGSLGRPMDASAPGGDDAGAAWTGVHRHVLVVEDEPLNQLIVCTMLQNAGCRTTTAAHGREALRLLMRESFDLVLMDWQMPEMDGLEVTRRLRAGAAGVAGMRVPIVALTANAFVEDRAACLAAGMNDFLTKPVEAVVLERVVQRWVPASGQPSPGPRLGAAA